MIHHTEKTKKTRPLALGMFAALLIAVLLLNADPAQAATTFTVNSTGDKGDLTPGNGECFTGDVLSTLAKECTLRAAIQEANATAGADTIVFDIPGSGVHTIAPASELPAITGAVTIDGYSQQGASPNTKAVGGDAVLKIQLGGANAGTTNGLWIRAANSTVRGLAINLWDTGIRIEGSAASGNRITGNYIGTDTSGTQDLGNSRGVYIVDAPNTTVGGATAAERNVISGNEGEGVNVDGSGGNKVVGNYIGTNRNGSAALGNSYHGVNIESASGTTVGGTTAAERNVISGNGLDGVFVQNTSSSGNKITGNFIGTDATGMKDLGNDDSGVVIEDAPGSVVGGTTAGERNVISGNGSTGVVISGLGGNRVMGNYIGIARNGTTPLGNDDQGVFIGSSPNNTVGGTSAGARNVISANDDGVLIYDASGNRVLGNYVGTDASGMQDLGNTGNGVDLSDAVNTTIGGTTAGARNVISGNQYDGVHVYGTGGNKVIGNHIGVDASGIRAVGNGENGVNIDRTPNNVVGGTTAGERNVISGNFIGVLVEGAAATGNRVLGNFVGTASNGTAPLGNYHGVLVTGASGNTIGGTEAGARNVISASQFYGVGVFGDAATGNRILSNSIFSNVELGIDLLAGGNRGRTPNDPGDIDTGPNNLQNFPIVTSARTGSGTTTINARLNSTPNKMFFVQFFSNPKGTDEGKTLLGSRLVTTDASGNVSFSFSTTKSVLVEQNITATATGGGNTSEFSAPRAVVAR